MRALNNATTTDGYTLANSRLQAKTRRVNIEVFNAAIFYQLAHDDPAIAAMPQVQTGSSPETIDLSAGYWQDEVFMAPGRSSLDESCGGIRIRSAVAGTPAQVTAKLKTAADIGETA